MSAISGPSYGRLRRQHSHLTQSYGPDQMSYDFIYNSWDTLSAEIGDKIRSGSVRVDNRSVSHCLPPVEERDERSDEKAPLAAGRRGMKEYDAIDQEAQNTNLAGISWMAVAFGLANASIGVGILNYPYIYNRVGGIEIATFIQLCLIACLFLSMSIIIYCSDLHNSCSYHEVLSSICGPRAKSIVALDIALATYGICVAYLVIIGDQYDRMFASLVGPDFCKHWYLDRRFTITLTGVFIYPICLLKKLDFLRHTGPLGIFAMLYVVFLTIYQHYKVSGQVMKTSPVLPTTQPNATEDTWSAFQVISCVPVILFGYQCNEIIVPIYASLKYRKIKNFFKAAILAYAVLIVLYCSVGSFGYLTYGSQVSPNVIMMFDATDPLVLVGLCALIFKMVVTYPQMAFAGREAYAGILKEFSSVSIEEFNQNEPKRRFRSATFWFLSSLLISAFAPHIGIVLELLGILAAFNVFICPALCLIFLIRRKDMGYSTNTNILFGFISAVLIPVGIVFFVFVVRQVYADILEAIHGSSSSICVIGT